MLRAQPHVSGAHGRRVLLPPCCPRGEAGQGSGKLGGGAVPPAGDARRAHRYIPGCAVLADWARASGHADGLLPTAAGEHQRALKSGRATHTRRRTAGHARGGKGAHRRQQHIRQRHSSDTHPPAPTLAGARFEFCFSNYGGRVSCGRDGLSFIHGHITAYHSYTATSRHPHNLKETLSC